jgi:hypothetical protein
MRNVTRHYIVRLFALVLGVLLGGLPLAGAAHADPDGYTDNFAGDVVAHLSTWDQSANAYVDHTVQTNPGQIKTTFDQAWAGAKDTFCADLDAGIKANDGGFAGRIWCKPTAVGELRAKNLGLNQVGLRYFVPGSPSGAIYVFNHNVCIIVCVAFAIDVNFDVTIDVTLQADTVVGTYPYADRPLRVVSALLTISNPRVVEQHDGSRQTSSEAALAKQHPDISSLVSLDSINQQIHSGAADLAAVLNSPVYGTAFRFGMSADSSALNLTFRRDTYPTLDPARQLATVAGQGSASGYVGVFGVDTKGQLWEQANRGGWQHWVNHGFPPAIGHAPVPKIVGSPGAFAGTDGSTGAFVTGSNGYLYEWTGQTWRATTTVGTKITGTPAATNSGTVPRVAVFGHNGHVEFLSQDHHFAFTWTDLGAPPSAVNFIPSIVAAKGYVGVVVTQANGHLAVRENIDGRWHGWRDLGTMPASAASAPSTLLIGSQVTAYVTGADGNMIQASWSEGSKTYSIWEDIFYSMPVVWVASAPSAIVLPGTTQPVIFFTDSNGELRELSQVSVGIFVEWVTTDYGSLPGTTMGRVSAVSAPNGYYGAFAVGQNYHVGEAHNIGSIQYLSDHTAL